MSFQDDVNRFAAKVATNSRAIFVNSASHAHESIVNGSPVTGAPGQPVDTGALRASWVLSFDSQDSASISTNLAYAPANEYGITDDGRPYTQKSPVGGRHSVALTVAGFDRIVAVETAKVVGP
jgi:hypothetical protein